MVRTAIVVASLCALATGASGAAAVLPEKHRDLQFIPICEVERTDCVENRACNTCLRQGTIPPNPRDATNCADIQQWFDGLQFPLSCDYINASILSAYTYCLFDTYSFNAGVTCKGDTAAPTAAPTSAPTAAPTLMPTMAGTPEAAPVYVAPTPGPFQAPAPAPVYEAPAPVEQAPAPTF